MFRFILPVLLAVLIVVCDLPTWDGSALAQSTDTMNTTADTDVVATDQKIEVANDVADEKIAERLSGILQATGWFKNVRVSAKDGIVFFDGPVGSLKRQEWLTELASKTDGVVAVLNRTTVEQGVQTTLQPALAELQSLWKKFIATTPLFLLALLVLPLAVMLSRRVAQVARWTLRSRIDSPFLLDVIARVIAAPVLLIGIYIVLQVAGLTGLAISLLGGAGVIGIVVGFAFRDIAENFLASLLLSVRQPFRRGDYVRISGHEGTIHSMNTRSTVLVSPEGNHIQIPNATVFKSDIENFSVSATRRDSFEVGVGYDVAITSVQEIILAALAAQDAVIDDPDPMVLADSLGASTVNIKIYYWFDGSKVSALKLRSAIIRRVKRDLMAAGISMPDDAREVIFPQGVPIIPERPVETTPAATSSARRSEAVCGEPDHSVIDTDLSTEDSGLDDQMQATIEGEPANDLLSEKSSDTGQPKQA